MNKIILLGNATRAAELRSTTTGKAVASFRLATNRQINGQEETQFHTVVCWEGLAETVAGSVRKGDPLYVEGRVQYRTFQDDEGRDRGTVEIVANEVLFLARHRLNPTSSEEPETDSREIESDRDDRSSTESA